MSQTVFTTIDPTVTTGLILATTLNDFKNAVLSNYSGATEPAVMYAYQWWADTTTNLLKIRNSANSAWVSVASLTTGGATSTTRAPTAVTTTYTVLSTDEMVMCATGTYTVTLPLASSSVGKTVTVIKKEAAGVITIAGNVGAGNTINGIASVTLENRYSSVEVYCDGNEWFITG